MCNPCQEGDDHAQGHPVGSSHPRGEGIGFVYIVLVEGLYFWSICRPRPSMQISSILLLLDHSVFCNCIHVLAHSRRPSRPLKAFLFCSSLYLVVLEFFSGRNKYNLQACWELILGALSLFVLIGVTLAFAPCRKVCDALRSVSRYEERRANHLLSRKALGYDSVFSRGKV